jgi:hypothetical protein
VPRIETGEQFMVKIVTWFIVHLRYLLPRNVYGRVVGEGWNFGGNGRLLVDVLSWCVCEWKKQNRKKYSASQ